MQRDRRCCRPLLRHHLPPAARSRYRRGSPMPSRLARCGPIIRRTRLGSCAPPCSSLGLGCTVPPALAERQPTMGPGTVPSRRPDEGDPTTLLAPAVATAAAARRSDRRLARQCSRQKPARLASAHAPRAAAPASLPLSRAWPAGYAERRGSSRALRPPAGTASRPPRRAQSSRPDFPAAEAASDEAYAVTPAAPCPQVGPSPTPARMIPTIGNLERWKCVAAA